MTDIITRIRERFESATAEHNMEVLFEAGLRRHLRFQAPRTVAYEFDLVTWPGYLVICGDIGSYTFSRVPDMFEFFAADKGHINPQYWAEKLVAESQPARTYSHAALRAAVLAWARETAEYQGRDVDEVVAALEQGVLAGETVNEVEGRLRLDALEEAYGPQDCWEWDLTDWSPQFIWCCLAIAHGVQRYRARLYRSTGVQ